MKLNTALALQLLLLPTASAFSPQLGGFRSKMTRLSMSSSRVDSSEAVKAALEASKKYGATSPEARVAWDIVEEMDSRDNR